jgi:homocysteine S-methyltransferase
MVNDFNSGHRMDKGYRTSFSIGVAINPNVRSMSGQISKLQRKIEAGAHYALTQPIFSIDRLDMLQDALAKSEMDFPFYIGIMPLTSLRNAEFLHNEVPGIVIPDEMRERLARYSTVAEQRAVGLEMATELVEKVAARVHGIYLIAPRNKVELITPLVSVAKLAMIV